MSRKKAIATVSLAVVGLGGLAYAADEKNPILQLAQAVELVHDNTVEIQSQASMIAKETSTVVQQNVALANQTAALAKANQQLDQKLDVVLSAISKIEVPPPAPSATPSNPAHTVWLAPYVNQLSINNRATWATATMLNAGVVPAKVSCHYFYRFGPTPDKTTTITIEPGHLGDCTPGIDIGVGWLLIVSDHPVVATGRNTRQDNGTFSMSENMPLRPLDCAGDVTGIEHVCELVNKLDQGK